MANEGKKSRKQGRHDRGPKHHTPEQALRNKAMRVLRSNGVDAFAAFCDEHKLYSLRARVVAERLRHAS